MTFTHEQLLDAVRKAGRDGQTFSCAAVREQLNLSTRDRRVLSRFHRQFRAFQEAAADEIVKVGNNSYRLTSAAPLEAAPSPAATSGAPLTAAGSTPDATAATIAAAAPAAQPAEVPSVPPQSRASDDIAELPAASERVPMPVSATSTPSAADGGDTQATLAPREPVAVSAPSAADGVDAQATVAPPEPVSEPVAVSAPSAADGVDTQATFEPSSATWSSTAVSSADDTTSAFEAAAPVLTAPSDTDRVEVAAPASELPIPATDMSESEPLAAAADAPSTFFDEAPGTFDPASDTELELHELVASVPLETQPDARRSMLSLAEAAQLFEAPAPREPRQPWLSVEARRVRAWVSTPLEHAQNLLSGSWRERGQRLGRRVAGLFHRA